MRARGRADLDEAGRSKNTAPASALPWLQVAPLSVVLALFVGLPLGVVVVVSFFDFDRMRHLPGVHARQLRRDLHVASDLRLYLKLVKYAADRLGDHAGARLHRRLLPGLPRPQPADAIGLFLVCAVPFWTSNIIRMISWIPFLGRNGIFNQALMAAGVIHEPLEFLLFSDFAVILAYVHLFTLFMIVPIFNSMARIDRPARGRARRRRRPWQVVSRSSFRCQDRHRARLDLRHHPGHGRLLRRRDLSGGQSASVVSAMSNEIDALQYPPAAASAVVLVVIVMLMVAPSCASSTCARNWPDEQAMMNADGPRPWTFYCLGRVLRAVRAVPLRADVVDLHPVLPGAERRHDLPAERRVAALVRRAVRRRPGVGDIAGSFCRSMCWR